MTRLVRGIDGLGRLVIPVGIRRFLDLSAGTPVEMFVGEDGTVILRRYQPGCAVCGEADNLTHMAGSNVALCPKCIGAFFRAMAQDADEAQREAGTPVPRARVQRKEVAGS